MAARKRKRGSHRSPGTDQPVPPEFDEMPPDELQKLYHDDDGVEGDPPDLDQFIDPADFGYE